MIAIKGLRQGLLIVFDSTVGTPWLSQLYELQRKIETSSNFFKGGRIAFDVKSFTLSVDEIERAKAMLGEHEVTLWAIISTQELTCARVKQAGLAVTLSDAPALVKPTPIAEPVLAAEDQATPSTSIEVASAPVLEAVAAPATEPAEPIESESANEIVVEGTDGLLVRKRVRSGQVLRHPGHIVVIGDVNPGAALIAGGDIIVWGRLQGSAHAGALGDENATVCALDLIPSLLRIADATRVSHNDKRRQPKPETAMLQEQEILLVPWQAGR